MTSSETWTVIVMGVAGSGKSSVAVPLAERLGAAFVEADDHHPPANVAKMSAGHPLTDQDRWPWLQALAAEIGRHHAAGRPVVMTCSALKRSYRDVLRTADPELIIVHLTGTPEVIAERMRRRDHFMPPALLESQFAALEAPDPDTEPTVEIDITRPIDGIVDAVVDSLRAHGVTEAAVSSARRS